jgi:recombination protein RecR
MLPNVLEDVVTKLKEFPGLGTRSSRKLALDILDLDPEQYDAWVDAMTKMRNEIGFCDQCGFFASLGTAGALVDGDQARILCAICNDRKRNPKQICVVEKPTDVLLIERSENYSGLYFVLGGLISPLDNIFAEDTAINELLTTRLSSVKLESDEHIEVILFFRAGFSADATTAYIKEKLLHISSVPVVVSKLAQGLPLYYNPDTLDQATMSLALSDRREV